jgi:GT2 family glycosyltransferase
MINIVSVCFNDAAALPAFLENIESWRCSKFRLIIVDNGSRDNSVDLLRQSGKIAKILQLRHNRGTTGGWNHGIREALSHEGEYLMFLSLDVLLQPECLDTLYNIMQADARIGVLGPILLESHRPSTIETMGGLISRADWRVRLAFNGEQFRESLPATLEVDYVDGGTSLFRVNALKAAGYMDEELFMYGEDIDMCLRIKANDYRAITTSRAKAWHRHTELKGGVMHARQYAVYYMQRNLIYLHRKHAASFNLMSGARATLRAILKEPAYCLVKRRRTDLAYACVIGIWDGLVGKMGKRKFVS